MQLSSYRQATGSKQPTDNVQAMSNSTRFNSSIRTVVIFFLALTAAMYAEIPSASATAEATIPEQTAQIEKTTASEQTTTDEQATAPEQTASSADDHFTGMSDENLKRLANKAYWADDYTAA